MTQVLTAICLFVTLFAKYIYTYNLLKLYRRFAVHFYSAKPELVELRSNGDTPKETTGLPSSDSELLPMDNGKASEDESGKGQPDVKSQTGEERRSSTAKELSNTDLQKTDFSPIVSSLPCTPMGTPGNTPTENTSTQKEPQGSSPRQNIAKTLQEAAYLVTLKQGEDLTGKVGNDLRKNDVFVESGESLSICFLDTYSFALFTSWESFCVV